MSTSEGATIRKDSQIETQLEKLCCAVEVLLESQRMLEGCLGLVLRPPEPDRVFNEASGKVSPLSVPLADRLQREVLRIEGVNNGYSGILERLDLRG